MNINISIARPPVYNVIIVVVYERGCEVARWVYAWPLPLGPVTLDGLLIGKYDVKVFESSDGITTETLLNQFWINGVGKRPRILKRRK